MSKTKHIDLFSGIGGFALAADRVFGEVEHIFCDNEPFAQEVLKKHWPNSKLYGDIRTLTNTHRAGNRTPEGDINEDRKTSDERWEEQPQSQFGGQIDTVTDAESGKSREQTEQEGRENTSGGYFLLTGGFPCQPFSQAGRRKGTEDDRYLWPEMLRVIREFEPTWVIAENVRGLLTQGGGVVFEQVCTDLEDAGYEVQPIVIPAVAVNAPHRRDRVWFIANKRGAGLEATRAEQQATGAGGESETQWDKHWHEVATAFCGVFNGLSTELDEARLEMNDVIYSKYVTTFNKITGQDLPCLWKNLQSEEFQRTIGRFNTIQHKEYLFTVLWQYSFTTQGQNYLPFESKEVQDAFVQNVWNNKELGCPPCGWEYNEQYAEEHKDSLSQLSHEITLATEEVWKRYNKDRNNRLKSLGNSIVPQVAEEIMQAIKHATRQN